MLEYQHGGTHSSNRCSTHHDDVSHTFNRQTATKKTKVVDVFGRCPFILSGTRLWCHGPRGPIGLEFYTFFIYRSHRQHFQKCPRGCSVKFPRRVTYISLCLMELNTNLNIQGHICKTSGEISWAKQVRCQYCSNIYSTAQFQKVAFRC